MTQLNLSCGALSLHDALCNTTQLNSHSRLFYSKSITMPLFVNLIALFLTWISQIVLRAHGVEVPFIIPCMSTLTPK